MLLAIVIIITIIILTTDNLCDVEMCIHVMIPMSLLLFAVISLICVLMNYSYQD